MSIAKHRRKTRSGLEMAVTLSMASDLSAVTTLFVKERLTRRHKCLVRQSELLG